MTAINNYGLPFALDLVKFISTLRIIKTLNHYWLNLRKAVGKMMDHMIILRVTSYLKFSHLKFNFVIRLKIKRDLREFIHKQKTSRLLLMIQE